MTARRLRAFLPGKVMLIALAAALVSGCAPDGRRGDFHDHLVAGADAAPVGCTLDLSTVLDDAGWDRLVVFPPYSSNEMARETLGFAWDIEGTPSQVSDGTQVLALVESAAVVAWFVIGANEVDFNLQGRPLALDRVQAKFTVHRGEHDWIVLRAAT